MVRETDQGLRLIEGCYVIDSSGCHRYDYWNEQALFDGCPKTGWCTPSRTEFRQEYLEVELTKVAVPVLLRLQERPIKGHPGFPRRLRLYSRVSSLWREVLTAVSKASHRTLWHEWELAPIAAKWIRLVIEEVEWRPEGKYFVQFMQMELLERIDGIAS